MYQDSIGYMWFSTDNGIARYDGNQILNINTEKFFETTVIFNFFEESKHKVWVNTDENKLYWFNPFDVHFEFHPYIYNDSLSNALSHFYLKNYIRKIYLKKDNSLIITFLRETGYMEIDKKGVSSLKYTKKKNFDTHLTVGLQLIIEDGIIYTKFKKNQPEIFSIRSKNYKEKVLTDNYNSIWMYGVSDFIRKDKIIYILVGKYLIITKENKVNFIELPSEALNMCINNKSVYVTTFNGVVKVIENQIVEHFLKDYVVTSVIKDSENGFWFSTLDNGVFYNENSNITRLTKYNKYSPKEIILSDSNLLVLNNHAILDIFDLKGNLKYNYNNTYHINANIISKTQLPSEIFNNYISYRFNDKMFSYSLKKDKIIPFVEITPLRWNDNYQKIILKNIHRFFDYCILNDSLILLASNDGLIEYNYKTNQYIYLNIGISKNEIIKTINQRKNRFYLISDNFLYIYTIKNAKLNFNSSLHKKNDLYFFESNNIFWSYKGKNLKKYSIHDNKIKIKDFSTQFTDFNILAFVKDSNYLWIGTKGKILRIDNSDLKLREVKLHPSKFSIDSLFLNQKHTPFSDTIYTENGQKINLFFNYLSFKINKPNKFEY